MHVPRSVVIGFLITVGCAIGWFLSGSAQAAPDGRATIATAPTAPSASALSTAAR
jgi:hypothetical protein